MTKLYLTATRGEGSVVLHSTTAMVSEGVAPEAAEVALRELAAKLAAEGWVVTIEA